MCILVSYHLKHMLSNFLNIHHDSPSYVIVPEREKNSKKINPSKFCTKKSSFQYKSKDRNGNHFNMCVQEGIVIMRSMTKYDTKHHHERFTAKLQVYSLAIFKIVQSHYLSSHQRYIG